MPLNQTFTGLIRLFTTDERAIHDLWSEVESCYSHKTRSYHNLTHIEDLVAELVNCKDYIEDWETILFAAFYHDLVYNILRHDNEEKSAERAVAIMRSLGVSGDRILRCRQHILATKGHQVSDDADTNFFTDADLAVLGKEWNIYSRYVQQIRNEYAWYPDLIYKPGRKKVLTHFLSMERIYKTDIFYAAYENQARKNLTVELNETNFSGQ